MLRVIRTRLRALSARPWLKILKGLQKKLVFGNLMKLRESGGAACGLCGLSCEWFRRPYGASCLPGALSQGFAALHPGLISVLPRERGDPNAET